MPKQKPSDEPIVDASPAPVVNAPEPEQQFVPGPGEVLIGLLDAHRTTERFKLIPAADRQFRILVDWQTYEQVGTGPDGRTQYAPAW